MALNYPIFNMFGRSPIRPLQKHISKAHQAAQTLLPFFEAVQAGDWKLAAEHQHTIAELEHKADNIKRDLRLHLPKGLFLPVPRTDILELLSVQDRIANKAKDIAGLVLGRKMQIPAAITDSYMALLKRSLDASHQAKKAINELDELLETGFRGNEVKLVEEMILKLDEIEQDTDEIQVKVRQALFEIESKLSPIDVIFLYKIVERTGDLADCAQTVGGRLQVLLAR